MALLDIVVGEREDPQQRKRLLGLLIGNNVLNDRLGLAILGYDHGLADFAQFLNDLGGVGFEIADGLDAGGAWHAKLL